MLLDCALLIAGTALLYFGAEWLVEGAAGLGRALGVSQLAIGLTVVSYGTSAPELAVSLVAAFQDQSTMALSNVIGSNVANIGAILGLIAVLAPPTVAASLFKREVVMLVVATGALPLVLMDGRISRWEGFLLFLGSVAFTAGAFLWAKSEHYPSGTPAKEQDDFAEEPNQSPPWRTLGLVGLSLLGIAGLSAGGKVFVAGASGLANAWGMSERLVGLTIVALGTSLPELAASVVAARKGHSDIAVGNVVGSNVFNLLLILGATSLLHPIVGSLSVLGGDILFMAGLTALAAWTMRTERRISRAEGVLYLVAYAAFIVRAIATN